MRPALHSLPPDPGPAHPADLTRVVVLGRPPWPGIGMAAEVEFEPRAERYIAGVFRIPGGRRVTVVADPAMDVDEFAIEDALTGAVVRRGRIGEALQTTKPGP